MATNPRVPQERLNNHSDSTDHHADGTGVEPNARLKLGVLRLI